MHDCGIGVDLFYGAEKGHCTVDQRLMREINNQAVPADLFKQGTSEAVEESGHPSVSDNAAQKCAEEKQKQPRNQGVVVARLIGAGGKTDKSQSRCFDMHGKNKIQNDKNRKTQRRDELLVFFKQPACRPIYQ